MIFTDEDPKQDNSTGLVPRAVPVESGGIDALLFSRTLNSARVAYFKA